MDPDTKELLNILLANENRLVEDLRKLAQAVDSAAAKQWAAIGTLTANVDAYVKASHERMQYIEKQLDALIRALTIKPMNGKAE